MLGFTFQALKKFAIEKYGPATWERVVQATDLYGRSYLIHKAYPDEEAAAVIEALAAAVGSTVPKIMEAFGESAAPAFLDMAKAMIRPEWKTLDILEHTESTIHTRIRAQLAEAKPPHLVCRRIRPDAVQVIYSSKRKLCPTVRGISRGLAKIFNEQIHIDEQQCMYHGHIACRMVISLVGQKVPRP
jgi:hypothetical protein